MAKMVRSRGGDILTIPADLSKEAEIHRITDEILNRYGRLDVLVNNAAASLWKTVEEMTARDWDFTIAVNLKAPFILSKAFLETMKAQGGGSIINVTSTSAEIGFVAEVAYVASKYGIEGLTQCLALELKPHNIAANTLNVAASPGKVLKPTGLTLAEAEKMPKEIQERYADDFSMVDSFTDAWVFMALQDANGVTGQRIGTRDLAEYIKKYGWEAAVANWRKKLTRAVYVTYDFPKSVRYQTPEGGHREIIFE
jgi:NAD(P)-dependent dehydrogenase (short-subunit alcohol dehydrogenase family)